MGAPRHALPRGKEPARGWGGAVRARPVSCGGGGVGRPAGPGPGGGRPGCQLWGRGPARPLGPRGSGGDPAPAPSAPLCSAGAGAAGGGGGLRGSPGTAAGGGGGGGLLLPGRAGMPSRAAARPRSLPRGDGASLRCGAWACRGKVGSPLLPRPAAAGVRGLRASPAASRLPARPAGVAVSLWPVYYSPAEGSPHGAGSRGPVLGFSCRFGRGVSCVQLSLCAGPAFPFLL